MATLDPETEELLRQAEQVELMLGGEAWGIVKQKIDEKILDLQNIENIDENNLQVDLKARIMASKLLFNWLKHDVYGFAEQQRANARQRNIDRNDGFIERGDTP